MYPKTSYQQKKYNPEFFIVIKHLIKQLLLSLVFTSPASALNTRPQLQQTKKTIPLHVNEPNFCISGISHSNISIHVSVFIVIHCRMTAAAAFTAHSNRYFHSYVLLLLLKIYSALNT